MSDNETAVDEPESSLSLPYYIFTVSGALLLISLLLIAGVNRWPLVATILIGAAAQTVYRIIKRTWSNTRKEENALNEDKDWLLSPEFIKNIVLIYMVMIIVSTFWYSIGWAANWLWRAIF